MSAGQVDRDALGRSLRDVRLRDLERRHRRAVLAYALVRVEDPEEAAQVVVETFRIAERRLVEIPGGGQARLWLYRAAGRVLGRRRDSGRRRHHSDWATPGEAEDRELLLLVTSERLSIREAARVLGFSSMRARWQLRRARRRSRQAGASTSCHLPPGSSGSPPLMARR